MLNYGAKRLYSPVRRIKNFTLKINHYKSIKSQAHLRLILNKVKAQYSVSASLSYAELPTIRSN
jgi:hypothetical protein